MRLGVVNQETWGFFNEIFEAFQKKYSVDVFARRSLKLPIFRERTNEWLYLHDLQNFMAGHEVVFFEWASNVLVSASQLPKVCSIVTRLHRYEMYQWVNQVNWEAVDKIIVVSEAKKQEFVERFPAQKDKLVVSGPSTSLDKFTPQPKTFGGDLGILCHLTPRKRVYDLILVFAELLKVQEDLHLHIAGGTDPAFEDYYYALQSVVIDLKLGEKVTFYGNVKDTWNWYHKIDIFISNSYSEGLQVAPMEAMASGCYCLSHHWRGAEELLPEEYLFFTDTELKDKVLKYCAMPEVDREAQKKRMRVLAEERFDINQTIRQIICAIDNVSDNVKAH